MSLKEIIAKSVLSAGLLSVVAVTILVMSSQFLAHYNVDGAERRLVYAQELSTDIVDNPGQNDRQREADNHGSDSQKRSESNSIDRFASYQQKWSFASLASFEDYLKRIHLYSSELERAVDYLTIEPSAVELLKQELLISNNPQQISVLSDLLTEIRDPRKVDIALSLIESDSREVRSKVYQWLRHGANSDNINSVINALISASHNEPETSLMTSIIASLPLNRLPQESTQRMQLVGRLQDLTFHTDRAIAIEAISTLAQHDSSHQTLQILQVQLQHANQDRQLAALDGLLHFGDVSTQMRLTLESMLNNPQLSRDVRAKAAKVLIDFENHQRVATGVF